MTAVKPPASQKLFFSGVRPTAPDVAPAAITSGSIVQDPSDGHVTGFQDNGTCLQTAALIVIFWGSTWGNPVTKPSQADYTNAMNNLIYGPWGTQLAQYHGIGPLSVLQVVAITSSDPPDSFADSDVTDLISGAIYDETVPAPSATANHIYCVLLPQGCASKDHTSPVAVGYHNFFTVAVSAFNPKLDFVYWCWAIDNGSLTSHDSIPKVISHEIAETVTDPADGNGILLDQTGQTQQQEIGDVCNSTFGVVNGFAQQSYWSEADNCCVLPMSQPLPGVGGNPVLIQSKFGTRGNFELVASLGGELAHFWRNNDNPFLPWSTENLFFPNLEHTYDAVTMIQGNYGSPGNLEAMFREGNTIVWGYRDNEWHGPFSTQPNPVTGASGNPVLIQSKFGKQGNFELVTPMTSGGLAHYWRNNDDPNIPWGGPTLFGTGLGQVDAVTMIQSNYGSPGNLEVMCRVGDQIVWFWRDSGWNGPFQTEPTPITGASGNPVLIQSTFGKQGNFELVTPMASGGLGHYWRNNDDPNIPWSGPELFGTGLGQVDAVTMIQSNYGSPGNFEVMCRVGDQLYSFVRANSNPKGPWFGPYLVSSTTW